MSQELILDIDNPQCDVKALIENFREFRKCTVDSEKFNWPNVVNWLIASRYNISEDQWREMGYSLTKRDEYQLGIIFQIWMDTGLVKVCQVQINEALFEFGEI